MKKEVKAKREYEKPKVVYERRLEAFGGVCQASGTSASCSLGGCSCGLAS